MEALARVYSDEIWAAYAAGEFTYYEEGFEVSSGQWVSGPVVGGQLIAHLVERRPDLLEELQALGPWVDARDVVLSDGTRINEGLWTQLGAYGHVD